MADVRNRLGEAISPYLLQHSENPVHWQPWDETALAEARACDKPILLSVGYAACHWCHVMAHESFENPAIAALMNEHFINIKVDREERPDLDQLYQHALALLGQHGGWPLTMFLTPVGEPFWGGTYFPPESRYGRPGFPEVLETVARIWRDDRDRVTSNTTALKDALARLATPARSQDLSPAFVTETAQRLIQAFDTIHGGFAGAPKFPQAPVLRLLWRQGLVRGDQAIRQAVLHTLANICQGGIYDHLGGGFARYSVDALWLVPHFEKMLYDNAQLIALLSDAWADTHDPLFAARVVETVGWLEREMLVEDAFASSLDADSEGEEGKFYVWDAAEIDRLLGRDAPAFRLAYGVTDTGNWEGKSILNRLHQPRCSALPSRRRPCGRARTSCWRRERSGCGRGATTRYSPTGMGSPLARLPGRAPCFNDRHGWSARKRRLPSSAEIWGTATGLRTVGVRAGGSSWHFWTTTPRWPRLRWPCSSTPPPPSICSEQLNGLHGSMRTTSIPPAATIRSRRLPRTSWFARRTRRTGPHPQATARWWGFSRGFMP